MLGWWPILTGLVKSATASLLLKLAPSSGSSSWSIHVSATRLLAYRAVFKAWQHVNHNTRFGPRYMYRCEWECTSGDAFIPAPVSFSPDLVPISQSLQIDGHEITRGNMGAGPVGIFAAGH